MTDHAPTADPAIVAFGVTRADARVTIYNAGACTCGDYHVTELPLLDWESQLAGRALLEMLRAVHYTERSADISDPASFAASVLRVLGAL